MLNLHEDLELVQSFQALLRDRVQDYEFVAWQLALAHTASIKGDIKYEWYSENEQGITRNGVTAINQCNDVLMCVEAGFNTEAERLLHEAFMAQDILRRIQHSEGNTDF